MADWIRCGILPELLMSMLSKSAQERGLDLDAMVDMIPAGHMALMAKR